MICHVVFLSEEPFYVKCSSEDEAMEIATRYQETLVAVASSESPILVREPRLKMTMEPLSRELIDFVGEGGIEEIREVCGNEQTFLEQMQGAGNEKQ